MKSNKHQETTFCKICRGIARLFDIVDFNKIVCDIPYPRGLAGIPVYYYRCESCRHLFTIDFDAWSADDFAKQIYNEDYIFVDPEYLEKRPHDSAIYFGPKLNGISDSNLKMLDYGSGLGLLAKYLAEEYQIYNVDSFDPYGIPSPSTEGKNMEHLYDFIMAIEVFEHWVEPVVEMAKLNNLLGDNGFIYVSTQLQPTNITRLGCAGWSYASPRNGHINLYSKDSLALLARYFSLRLESVGSEHFMFPKTRNASKTTTAFNRLVSGVLWRNCVIAEDILTHINAIEFNGSWHGNEPADTKGIQWFRWTGSDHSSILIRIAQGTRPLTLIIRVFIEILPEFLEKTTWKLNGELVKPLTSHQDNFIELNFGVMEIDRQPEINLDFVTPQVQSPVSIRGAFDDRNLGLAIGVELR